MYHFHTSDQRFCICYICDVARMGVLQLPNCATTSQWNVVELPIGMQLIVKPVMQYHGCSMGLIYKV